MPTNDTKTRTTVQYEIREIDKDGDSIDTTHVFTGPGAYSRAKAAWRTMEPGAGVAALVMERVKVKGCESEGVEDQTYTTRATTGDPGALRRGGWIK